MRRQPLCRLLRQPVVFLLVWLIPGLPRAATPHPTREVEEFIARLRESDRAVTSAEYIEETTSRDDRPGQPGNTTRTVERVHFDRRLGKERRAFIPSGETDGLGQERSARVAGAGSTGPIGVFALAGALAEGGVTLRADGKDRVVEITTRAPVGTQLGPLLRVRFDARRLPVRVESLSSAGATLDETRVDWSKVDGAWFPVRVETVYRSKMNTLMRAVHYHGLKLNRRISASVFEP